MKKVTSIGLIFLLSLQCFYKLGVITYFHLNRTYIAEVLCVNKDKPMTMCHGQCFLKKNLAVAVNDVTSDKHSDTLPIRNKGTDFPAFLISESSHSFKSIGNVKLENSRYVPGASSRHVPVPFHPPMFLSYFCDGALA